MRITRLSARNFMAFEEVDIDLSEVSAVAVTGKNNTGKSALLDIFFWALGGDVRRSITSKDGIIRDGTDSTKAVVAFSAQGHDVIVVREKQRGRTATLSLDVDGARETRHTIAETEEAIIRLIGLDIDGLLAGPIMAQTDAAAFMEARPADRKDLLARLFGLDRFERYWRAATDKHREAENQIAGAAALLESTRAKLANEAERRQAHADETTLMGVIDGERRAAADRVVLAKEKLAGLQEQINRRGALKVQRDSIGARMTTVANQREQIAARMTTARNILARPAPSFDADALREAENALEAAQNAAAERHRLTAALATAVADVGATKREVARMTEARDKRATVPCGGVGEFATCRFLTDIPDDAALNAAEGAAALAVLAESVARGAVALADEGVDVETARANVALRRQFADEARRTETVRAGAQATIDEAEAALRSADDTIAGLEAEKERVDAELADILKATEAVDAWRSEVSRAQADVERAERGIEGHRAALRRIEADLATIDAAKVDHEAAEARVAELQPLVDSLGWLAKAFHRDGIPTRILARGIPLIEAEANRVLERLPGGFSIALRTQRAKATGGMAETLDVIVTVGGWEREYGLLSVGARFRVDLALRLGLSRVLTHRTGGSIETLWLDEPLAALDEEGRLAVKETLAALGDDFGLIVAVSHHPDFNDAFDARIDVEQIDGVSTARLAA